MKTVNKVILMGYLAAEPTENIFDNGTKCVNLTLKTRDFYGSPGNKKVDKNFHNLIMWNGISEMAAVLLKKGDLLLIEGHLKNKKIEGKDGRPATYRTEIVVEEWTRIPISQEDEE